MSYNIEQLFLHIFIMLFIPFVHSFIKRDEKESYSDLIFTAALLLSLILTMLFPVKVDDNLLFDMKFIPIFISFFYLNKKLGITMIIIVCLFKLISNGHDSQILILNYTIMSILFFLFEKNYHSYSLLRKSTIALLMYFLMSTTRFISLIGLKQTSQSFFLFTFMFISFGVLTLVIYLLEMNQYHITMRKKLQYADKLNAISQLAASVAHEIRNPMTTIRGFMQLLKDEKNLTKSQNMYVSLSLDELDRTQQIIDDFLSLSRPNKQENETIIVSNSLRDVLEFLRPYSMISGVDFNVQIQEELRIHGDLNEFKQLIINIVKNGIESMPEGGMLEIQSYSTLNETIIKIKDEGLGISKEQLNQIGQPYYSTKTKGTGLGLMISLDILKRMNGKIKIDSKVGNGTCFTLSFPEVLDK
ncbi:ATP-binding protein [Bacillus sp. CGMCC 1.16607]|uniref:ATP-binding protein n=1 Tax=Bacillus sp. CGMCC 1.16607 TaxID=3351842 RepID=UPI00363746E6